MFQKLANLWYRILPEALHVRPIWVTLNSGIRICIDAKLTLDCFVELFITQPYVLALDLLQKDIDVVVDLGANRGLFPLFVSHYCHQRARSEKPRFVCVEAAESNFRALMRHVHENSLTDRVVPVRGAVCGRRSGTVQFYYSPRAHGQGVISNSKRFTTQGVPVIDLAEFVTAPKVDLLKIDIEGSEQGFLEEYPDILEKTQVLVGEFHLEQIDYARCKALLREAGLSLYSRTFQFEDRLCVEIYTRSGTIA